MEPKAHLSHWKWTSQRAWEMLLAGGVYNLCLVTESLDTHCRFPTHNRIKRLRDISSLLADEIAASAALLQPLLLALWVPHLIIALALKGPWGIFCCCHLCFKMGHFLVSYGCFCFQNLWARGSGVAHVEEIMSPPAPRAEDKTPTGGALPLFLGEWKSSHLPPLLVSGPGTDFPCPVLYLCRSVLGVEREHPPGTHLLYHLIPTSSSSSGCPLCPP